jgi:hypothetical protein
VYHPTNGDDNILLDHLRNSLIIIGGRYPGSGIIIAGDFNHLNIKQLCYEFNLKQLVNVPTRGSNILDLVLTNLHGYYKKNSLQIYPPFGLSDHLSLVIQPAERQLKVWNARTVLSGNLSLHLVTLMLSGVHFTLYAVHSLLHVVLYSLHAVHP